VKLTNVRKPLAREQLVCHHQRVLADFDRCYRAALSKDRRFDGWIYVAVTSTGIYCRPSCPATMPKRVNMRFYNSAAAAQADGFRACKRCRPDTTPGSPEWNARADIVGRAMRLITDGVVNREGVAGLARRLSTSARHLHRQLLAEVGAGPLAIARAQRAHTARALLETTRLSAAEVAFAAGFSSIRQFNDTILQVFAVTPSAFRQRTSKVPIGAGTIEVRLAYRAPIDARSLLEFLAVRAVPGIETCADGIYRRTLALPHGPGVVELEPAEGYVRCTLDLHDLRDLGPAVQRCRRLFDLDADPLGIDAVLRSDPVLAPLVACTPGRRVAGHVDGWELAVRAVLGQQVSVAGARTLARRLVGQLGTSLQTPNGALTHVFFSPATLAAIDPTKLPLPASRGRALQALACAVAEGRLTLDPGADLEQTRGRLTELPGIGTWTAAYVAMRALGDPDAFLPTDLGIRAAAKHLGLPTDPTGLTAYAERWRPWRSYATQHLWACLDRRGRLQGDAA
jgi:AraC family transcriptional regulator, regulatory protein of adaptative response / DNA-3-methyladenine glycosylase II